MPKKKKKKKKKSHSGNNDLALSYRIEHLPRPMKRKIVLNKMIRFITHKEELPEGWDILLRWRNSAKAKWREAEFMKAISDSRPGFNGLVADRLRRDKRK